MCICALPIQAAGAEAEGGESARALSRGLWRSAAAIWRGGIAAGETAPALQAQGEPHLFQSKLKQMVTLMITIITPDQT